MNQYLFLQSLQQNAPPDTTVYLEALWLDAKNNWKAAHDLIGELEDKTACWVHAYLHRKEGDIWNADYWYTKAGRKRPAVLLKEEWEQIVSTLLSNSDSND